MCAPRNNIHRQRRQPAYASGNTVDAVRHKLCACNDEGRRQAHAPSKSGLRARCGWEGPSSATTFPGAPGVTGGRGGGRRGALTLGVVQVQKVSGFSSLREAKSLGAYFQYVSVRILPRRFATSGSGLGEKKASRGPLLCGARIRSTNLRNSTFINSSI